MTTQYLYQLSDVWNAGGTTFTAIKMSVTDTASASGSLLMDLQVGGVSQFKVSKTGAVTAVGVEIPTISSTSTLTNKTLSSPTVSGTIAGGATWSGAQIFSNATTILGSTAAGAFGAKVYVTSGASTQTSLALYNPGVGLSHIGYDATDSRLRLYNCFADGFLANGFGLEIATTGVLSVKTSGGTAEIPSISSTSTLTNKTLSGVTIADATNIILNTTTGTKIGTATSQKLGFFNQTPVVQPTAVADATTAVDVITQLNALLTRMRNLGLIAT
jgi:hypothetical protein